MSVENGAEVTCPRVEDDSVTRVKLGTRITIVRSVCPSGWMRTSANAACAAGFRMLISVEKNALTAPSAR
jgi:hypothetical protein